MEQNTHKKVLINLNVKTQQKSWNMEIFQKNRGRNDKVS